MQLNELNSSEIHGNVQRFAEFFNVFNSPKPMAQLLVRTNSTISLMEISYERKHCNQRSTLFNLQKFKRLKLAAFIAVMRNLKGEP